MATDVTQKIARLRAMSDRANELEEAQGKLPQAETDVEIQAEKVAGLEKQLKDARAELGKRIKSRNALKIMLGIPCREKAGGEKITEEAKTSGEAPKPE